MSQAIELLLAASAFWALLFYSANWVNSWRHDGKAEDAVIYSLSFMAGIIALGFLGLMVK